MTSLSNTATNHRWTLTPPSVTSTRYEVEDGVVMLSRLEFFIAVPGPEMIDVIIQVFVLPDRQGRGLATAQKNGNNTRVMENDVIDSDANQNRMAMPVQFGLGRVVFILLITLCLVISCNYQPKSQDGWQAASAEEVGLDPILIRELLSVALEDQFPNLHSIIVVKDKRIVVEEYFGGFDKDTRHYTASVSKSVGSILLGIAMDQDLVPGLADSVLDMSLVELFPEYEAVLPSEQEMTAVKLRHVLSMSAGFEWDESTFPYSDERNDLVQANQSDDPPRFVFERPIVTIPGSVFNYNGGLSNLMSYLVQRESGMPADEFAKQHLFGPLGITDYEWERHPSGLTDMDGGLHLRPRDMAKLGQLYLDGGVWDGDRIVSREWVAESTQEHIRNSGAPNYGFQWWCGDFHYQGRSAYMYMASGHGGQKIFVIPAHNMVVVLTHAVFDNPNGELHNTAIMSRYVLPAVDPEARNNQPTTPDSATLAQYTGAYDSPRGVFTIELRNGGLYASSANAPTMELVPLTGSLFRGVVLDLLDVDFVFESNEDGKVRGGHVFHGFSDEPFVRHQDDGSR